MSWKKHFTLVKDASPFTNVQSKGGADGTKYSHYASHLPEVYSGHPNRTERYGQYETMDIDSEINAALDILAEFCTQTNSENGTGFDIHFHETPTESEIDIIKKQLTNWNNLNDFGMRLFKIFRNTLKYGDQVFIRDPETFQLYWSEMNKITKIIVNESEGKKPEQYIIKDINPNFENLTVTASTSSDHGNQGDLYKNRGYIQPSTQYSGGGGTSAQGRFDRALNEKAIESEHIVHASLTEGLDPNWPFGNSILEQVFKVYKQKELLEDAIIIYRIQRAPERRVFKIDVGNMPTHMAMAYVERIKNEIHQRRIPTQTGGGANMMDATYNPLAMMEDYFFPVTAEGRGSSIDVFPGGQNLGEITDLRFFTNKLFRGLRIPSSYLPTGLEDGTQSYNDGRVGTALIQEWRFNQYCKRLPNMIVDKLDQEFKTFMRWRGINIDSQLFDLKLAEPQNFAQYRQADVDSARIATFAQLEAFPYMSKRFLMKRYLGMTEQEMTENEEMWSQEQGDIETAPADDASLRNVGINPGTIAGDLENVETASEVPPGAESQAGGAPTGVPDTVGPGSAQGPGPGAAGAQPSAQTAG